MKLSKQQIKLHEEAMEYVNSEEKLNHGEKKFIIDNFQESYKNVNSKFGAFFTPYDIARDLSVEIPESGSIIDLCAGIGILSYAAKNANFEERKIVCVELNPDYVKVGKRILPEATWICGSILDHELIESLGQFDCAISNPPFGLIANNKQTNSFELKYKGSEFEYMTIEIA